MSERIPPRRRMLRLLILLVTILLTWGALFIGQKFDAPDLSAGAISPETYAAPEDFSLIDEEATQAAIQAAVDAVEPPYDRDPTIDEQVLEDIHIAFRRARDATIVTNAPELPAVTTTTLPGEEPVEDSTTTSSTQVPDPTDEEGATSTTVAETTTTTIPVDRTGSIRGQLYIDMDANDLFSEGDLGLPGVGMTVYDGAETQLTGVTGGDGTFTVTGVAPGEAQVLVDTESVPARLQAEVALLLQTVDVFRESTAEIDPIPLQPVIAPFEDQALILNTYTFSTATRDLLIQLASADVVHEMVGAPLWLDALEAEVTEIAADRLRQNGGILVDELADAKSEVSQGLRPVTLIGADLDTRDTAARAATELAAEFLQANRKLDDEQYVALQEAARDSTPQVTIPYEQGEIIVQEGQTISEQAAEALVVANVVRVAADQRIALLAVSALLVGTLFFYLARFRPIVWGQLRRLILFGLLVVLAAASARGVALFAAEDPAVGFLMPAAAFGMMAAILFDARIAVLMSMAVGGVTAIATLDPGYTLFAALATLAPVPFVSSISARGELRKAVVFMTVSLAVAAAATAWFFQGGGDLTTAAAFGAINGILSGLVGTAALSFLEIIFDVTTSLRLLDLTDRNHPALRLLEERALGTFNHSLMVGTLADRGARAVGANNLLALAAAYYHDLGKTENPQFFIENQFGVQNPHDRMPPEESANVIRQHVIDGVRLARRFRIPADVAEGVVCHHGDAIMRYFHGKAVERYGADNVDAEDYRHAGRKPHSKEMAILMMADSVEGACRAVFQEEDPSDKRIREVVERVVGEKVADGQLSESELTLGDLTKVKAAMVDALNGHYHQRIAYPNFPDMTAEEGPASDAEEPSAAGDEEGATRPSWSAVERPSE